MNFDLDSARTVLARTPDTLRTWLGGLPEDWTHANEGSDTWSPFDVVGHLVHGERSDWIPRARQILESGSERAFDPFDRFAQAALDHETLEQRLDSFAVLRARSLSELNAWKLSSAQLDLKGRHPAFGQVTLGQLLSTWVAHDLGHVAQIARVMAKRYSDEVGPWREYLPVLG